MCAWWNPFASSIEVYSDHYAKSRERLRTAVFSAIEKQLQIDDFVLFVVHFPETFLQWQDELLAAGFEPEILKPPVHAISLPLQELSTNESNDLRSKSSARRGQLGLALSEMLDGERPRMAIEKRRTISIISVQKHPLARHDHRVLSFARSLPFRVRLGYFLSLDDPLIAPFLGEWTELLLEQWGFREANLITSDLVSRRLNRARQRMDSQVKLESLADRPIDWLQANGPGTHYHRPIQNWLTKEGSRKRQHDSKPTSPDDTDSEDDDSEDE